MKAEQKQVVHRSFGVGRIVSQKQDVIEVRFSREIGTKQFLYPSVFERYLVVVDAPDLQKQIDIDLREMHERLALEQKQIEAERKRKAAETLRLREEASQAALEEKKLAAKKRAMEKKAEKALKKAAAELPESNG